MKPQRRRTKRPNMTNLMPVISSCSMSYASMSITPTKFLPEEPGTTLTAVDFVQKMNGKFAFQEKIKKQPGTVIIPEKLYLTSITEAQSLNYLKKNNITAILTINTEPVILPDDLQKNGIKTKFIDLGDNCTSNIKSYFDEINDFIDNNERVVVHCHAGISRSATAVIAYLMKTSRWTLKEALKFVQTKRHVVCPNFSFMGQLRSYQNDLEIEELGEEFMKKYNFPGIVDKTISMDSGFIPATDARDFMIDDLKAEKVGFNTTKKINPGFPKPLEIHNKDHDSGVDTSESSNESPLGSPKYKMQKVEFSRINVIKEEALQIKLQN